jgi:glucosamine-6-phosphate deaminase
MSVNKVPKMTLTVGVGTVMDAREVILIVRDFNKDRTLKEVLEGGISHIWTTSIIQMYQKGFIVCDEAATLKLQNETVKYFTGI